jgi:hypothetical protein
MMIIGLMTIGIVNGYSMAAKRAEWSGYSLAAQALSIQQIEQIRCARWDTQEIPAIDDTTNVLLTSVMTLDVPVIGTNTIVATNYVSVSSITISVNPAITMKMIRVDTVWPWFDKYFTNTLATFRAPDR